MKFHKSERVSYEINGQRYERLEDVPPEFRALLEDADGNGIPDFVERLSESSDASKTVITVNKQIVKTSATIDPSAARLLRQLGSSQSRPTQPELLHDPDSAHSNLVMQLLAEHPLLVSGVVVALLLIGWFVGHAVGN